MNFLIIFLILCFILFLFVLYSLSKDDFVILRKDISMETIFNTAFMVSLIALLMGRIFFISLHPRPVFFSVLGFLLFPYFPGLSLIGGVLGGVFFLFLYATYKKLPLGKFFDLFSLSFLFALPFGSFFVLLLIQNSLKLYVAIEMILFLVVLLVFVKLILPLSNRGTIRDGSLGLSFISVFSLISIFGLLIKTGRFIYFDPEIAILLIVFASSFLGLIVREIKEKDSSK